MLVGRGPAPVWHLTNRGRGFAEIESQIALAARTGLAHVLCIRGEYKSEDGVDTPKIREVVRMLGRGLPRARLSVSLNHHLGRRQALGNLIGKLEAGAHAVQTQVTFDLTSLEPFALEIKSRYPDVGITPMLMPVLSARAGVRLSRRLAIPLPARLLQRLESFGAEAGWDHFESFARAIAENPLYDGLAIMTPIDPDDAFVAKLRGLFGSVSQSPTGSVRAGSRNPS